MKFPEPLQRDRRQRAVSPISVVHLVRCCWFDGVVGVVDDLIGHTVRLFGNQSDMRIGRIAIGQIINAGREQRGQRAVPCLSLKFNIQNNLLDSFLEEFGV